MMDLNEIAAESLRRFEEKSAAREKALVAARRSIRFSANSIRAIHRGEIDESHRLADQSREQLDQAAAAVRDDHPDLYFSGYVQDAQKEYAESRLTEALVTGSDLPGPDELRVEVAPYLNGMAEAIGEGRRAILDLLRRGEVDASERILGAMEDMYWVLVSMDFPDAVTGNLRRSTDVSRSIMEKTRGDLSMSLVQRDLREALERHAAEFGKGDEPDRPGEA